MISILALLTVFGTGYLKYQAMHSAEMKPELSMVNGQFHPCPNKPNCVSSFEDGEHKIKPIQTSLEFDAIISNMEESYQLIKKEGNYAHFTSSTSLLGFVDDIEIYLTNGVLHIKSASRVGHSDLGANKKRVEHLRKILK